MLPRQPDYIGPYRIVRTLGRGGMGVVYEAQDPTTSRRLAVKVVLEAAASSTARERFWREAELLAKVRHPGVVTVHKLGRAAEGPYLVEELVEGTPLDRLCGDAGLPAARAAEAALHLARALTAIHGAGVLHRDLKPQNVIVRPDGRPVILDFGLARDVDSETLTRTGTPLGTPAYMSPEQARGQRDLDARTDVYGLGAVLYEMLTGRPPFEGASMIQLLNAVLTAEPVPVAAVRPEVPAELAAVCHMALAKSRAARYPDAAAMVDDLARFLRSDPTIAAGAARSVRARRLRRGAAIVALAGACVGAAALFVTSAPGSAPPGPEAPQHVAAGPAEPVPPPQPPALWTLSPGARLLLRSTVEETSREQAFSFDVELAARVEESTAEGRLRARGRCEHVRVSFGASELGGLLFDTRAPDPDHPLAGIAAGIGREFTFEVDPITGAIEALRGVDEIGAVIAARPPTGALFPPGLYRRFCKITFSDAYVEAVLRSLSWVRPAGGRPIDWALGPSPGEYVVPEAAASPAVVPPVGLDWTPRPEHRYRLGGRAHYADGRLVQADVRQELVGREGAPLDPRERSLQRWTAAVTLLQ